MSDLPAAVRERIRQARGEPVSAVQSLPGGANSEVWEVLAGPGKRYLAKRYPPPERDGVDRLGTEFAALGFLRSHGERAVPEPVCVVPEERVGVFVFVEGARCSAGEVGAAEVRQAAALLARIHSLRGAPGAERLAPAREACFSISAHEALVRARLARLRSAVRDRGGPSARELADFLDLGLARHVEAVAAWSRGEADRRGIDRGSELPAPARTLSPSDFGFHNALRTSGGELVFIDFEYFGWDDPAKTVADFLLQPQVPVPVGERPSFLAAARGIYGTAAGIGRRLPLVHAWLACKWCLIVLNVFLRPSARGEDVVLARERQLALARVLLARAREEHASGAFSFGSD